MTTVEDKLKKFTEGIIRDIENKSAQKIETSISENNEAIKQQEQSLNEKAQDIINSALKKAEVVKKQMVSGAKIEMDRSVLAKRNEIYRTLEKDIKDMSYSFTEEDDYAEFLQKSIASGISRLQASEFNILLKPQDIKKYGSEIISSIKEITHRTVSIDLKETNEDIIGGCILENNNLKRRVDCTLQTMIDDSRERLWKLLQEYL